MRTPNRWVVLIVIIVVTTIGMMGFAAPFSLLNVWLREFSLTKAEGGWLTGLWYLPGIVIALPAGWAFDRYSGRTVMVVLWGVIIVGLLLMAVAPNFVVLCLGRLIFSIGMNAHMVGAPKLLGSWFAGRKELGFVMGVYTLSFTGGVFLSLNLLGRIGETQGSAPALQLLTALSVAGLLLIALVPAAPEADDATSKVVGKERFAPWALGIGAWCLAISYAGYSIGTDAYLTFAPDFLVGRGLSLSVASSTVGSYALVALVLKPMLSAFLTRERALLYVVGATIAGLISVGLLFAPVPPLASAAAMGVSLALGMPSLLSLPNFLLPARQAGQGYGLFQLLYSLGFLAQPLVGSVVDSTSSYAAGFGVVGAYTLIGLAVLLPAVRVLNASRPATQSLTVG